MVTGTPQLALPIDMQVDGEVRVYRIVLPFLPPSKNVIDGWPAAWKSSAKKKWIRAIVQEVDQQLIPKHVAKIGLAATLVFPQNAARRDPQNYSQSLWNWVPDALQVAGVIDDDRDGVIDFGPNLGVKFAVDSRKAPKASKEKTILSLSMLVKA
jgi:hypothetical protein